MPVHEVGCRREPIKVAEFDEVLRPATKIKGPRIGPLNYL
jgi:hypothetical protein